MIHLTTFEHRDIDANIDIFRSNVSQFVNDTTTHPIVKYKAFIFAFLLIVLGLFILLFFNRDKIFTHTFWKHLFIPVTDLRDKYGEDADTDNIFGYDYTYRNTDAAIFREAIEGMSTGATKDGKVINADTESDEKKKKPPCDTDCGEYVKLKGKINDLSKYVNAVKEQKDGIKQTSVKLQELGKQLEDLNKSLSPGGQVKITI